MDEVGAGGAPPSFSARGVAFQSLSLCRMSMHKTTAAAMEVQGDEYGQKPDVAGSLPPKSRKTVTQLPSRIGQGLS